MVYYVHSVGVFSARLPARFWPAAAGKYVARKA